MAEAAVENQNNSTFYCHQCSVSIKPKLPDFTCPRCDNGFIEEITEEANTTGASINTPAAQQQQNTDLTTQLDHFWSRALLDSFRNRSSAQGEGAALTRERELEDEEQEGTRQQYQGLQQPRVSFRRTRPIRHQYLQGLLQYLTDRGHLGINILPLHGNPDDYAWGVGGLDAIITRLLNQLDGSGAPPAQKEKIEALPIVYVSQEQVDNVLQCSVCMDDFYLNEEVKRLPCDHHFHSDCIIPWLKIHGTCPVCRKDLNGEEISLKGSRNPLVDDTQTNNSSNGMT